MFFCFSLQSKTQDCYANLTLKPPRPHSGRTSPQIQYSDVVQLEELPESPKADEGNTDAVSTMSDLYASVQTQRTKAVNTADDGEGYANHLWENAWCPGWSLCNLTCHHRMALCSWSLFQILQVFCNDEVRCKPLLKINQIVLQENV